MSYTMRSHPASLAMAVCIALAIAVSDVVSGSEIRIFPLYFLPITLVTLRFRRWIALSFSLLCTALWVGSKFFDGTYYSSTSAWVWNTVMQGTAFIYVTLLVSGLQASREAERLSARKDALTNLANKRGFLEQAQLLLSLCKRSGHPLVFAYIDLDNFKKVNDEFGHKQGDEVLKLAAKSMTSTFRNTDLIGRLGGDEFVVLLPETSEESALNALERLRVSVQDQMRKIGCDVTASIGAVAYRTPNDSLDDITHAADVVMYAVKSTGKNQVKVICVDVRPADRPERVPA